MHWPSPADVFIWLEVFRSVVEEDAGAGDDDAGAERRREALAQADRHAALVAGAKVDRVAVAAVGVVEGANQAAVPLRVVRTEAVQRFEVVERGEGQVAAAVRWHLA